MPKASTGTPNSSEFLDSFETTQHPQGLMHVKYGKIAGGVAVGVPELSCQNTYRKTESKKMFHLEKSR
ncbi:hypothetical protein TNIN_91921 [Trichonephila inaurata madagascariensis]|uniref:Uncharacterized protein n=1 Tax=Trichonephila inaurata madagascariensis TaxID=2747483 RepID=A0A8X6XIX5_9ARAC|nr:hypothetical protein TNIN_91921 [Trichonephila inaurata madagascariensis]